MIKLAAIAAILAVPAAARAQECIAPQQIGDTAVVAAPFLVDSVVSACKAHLPASSFVNSGAAAFSQRLKTEGAPRVDSAVEILRMVAGKDIPQIDDRQALLTVIGAIAQGMIAKEIKPESCPGLDGVAAALAPLPTENIALLGVSAARLIAVEEEKKAAKRAAAAAEAAKAGEKPAEAAKEKSKKATICRNG